MKKLLLIIALVIPISGFAQVDKIVQMIKTGQPVHLHKDSTYDFSAYEMIPVTDSIFGNGAKIIHNRFFIGATGQNLTALFNMYSQGYFENVYFQGPTEYRGTTVYDKAFSMIIATGDATINKCNFEKCSKFSINAYGNKDMPTIKIFDCSFKKTQQQGFGYAIWVKNIIAYIENCTFEDNRHAVDGSNKTGEVYINNCVFYNHFVPINQHEEWGGIYGFKVMSIRNSLFYTSGYALQLMLPNSPTEGYVEVVNCHFSSDSIRVGTIANQNVWTFKHPQFTFKGNTHSSQGLPKPIEIKATPDSVPVGGRVYYESSKPSRWYGANATYKSKHNKTFDRPGVFVMRSYCPGLPYSFATNYAYESGKVFSFWLQTSGFGTAYVYRDNILIYVIPYSKAETWRQFTFRGEGTYKLVMAGSPTYQTTFHVDDIINGYIETFETKPWKPKVTYQLNGGPSISVGLIYTEYRSGQSCLELRLGANHPGTVTIN